MQLIENNVEQYKESLTPIKRNEGVWVESGPFFNIFNNFLILYNPSKYNTVFDWDNYWYETSDIFTPKDENAILHLKKINLIEKAEIINQNPKNEKNEKKEKNDKTERQSKEIEIKYGIIFRRII